MSYVEWMSAVSLHPWTLSMAVLRIAMPTANAQLSPTFLTDMMMQHLPTAVQEDTLNV
jgi:hypothetical protein